jgi:hypothetical protein
LASLETFVPCPDDLTMNVHIGSVRTKGEGREIEDVSIVDANS